MFKIQTLVKKFLFFIYGCLFSFGAYGEKLSSPQWSWPFNRTSLRTEQALSVYPQFSWGPKFNFIYQANPEMDLIYSQSFSIKEAGFFLRDPIFILSRSGILPAATISSSFDFYFLPSIVEKGADPKDKMNHFNFGAEFTTKYQFPKSNFKVKGSIALDTSSLDRDAKGELAEIIKTELEVNYKINSQWVTKHGVSLPFCRNRNASWYDFQWFNKKPQLKNTIQWFFASSAAISMALENYIDRQPKLDNFAVSLKLEWWVV